MRKRHLDPPNSHEDWKKVTVSCFDVSRCPADVRTRKPEMHVLRMMKDVFPAGPRAAMRAHAEFKAWIERGYEKGGPASDGVRQWDRLWRSWENYSVDLYLDQGVTTAEWDPVEGVDFSQVPKETPERKQKPKIRMRM